MLDFREFNFHSCNILEGQCSVVLELLDKRFQILSEKLHLKRKLNFSRVKNNYNSGAFDMHLCSKLFCLPDL